jgi:hypothetical protein
VGGVEHRQGALTTDRATPAITVGHGHPERALAKAWGY